MMEEGLISQSHFMDSERESATRMEGEEEEELYDFLPFQTEFLIPLRDRAFSWDVKFEDEIHGDNEGPAISVISEQQDSHRLVIKAKASTANKRQTENKEQESSATATADQSNKKSKNGAVNKKKETLGITSPTLVAGKANLKPTPTASSSNSNAGSSSGSKAVPAKSTATKANGTGAKTAAAARKLANMGVTASPSTDNLETQTLRNTINNAKSTVGETDYSQLFVKSEFPDSFGFGNEFDPTAPDRHGVSFDDGLNMHFKAEEDFPGLHEEAFGDDFRPPRKLSWNIDLNAIEAAMNSEGGFGSGSGSYLYDGPGGDSVGSGSFPSLLRASEAGTAYPDTSGMHGTGSSGGSTTMGTQPVNKTSGSAPMGITTTASRYLSSLSSGGMGGSDGPGGPSGQGATPAAMLPSNTTKAAERDHLASLMSGVGQSHAHSHGSSGLSLSGSYGATSTSHSGGMGSGTLLGGDATLSSSGAVGGLTLGGLTVPNDGEYRVGAYTKLERHLKIEAFREKKRTRIWRKQIKYDCRKRLADTRPRVKGRFVSRKGEKGGPTEGGDDTEAGGADGVDGGPDGAPQRLQHPPQATHATGVQGPGGNHGNVMHPPPGNMHHHPPHMSGHGGHGAMSHMPTGMLKQPGGYVGPNSAADAHHHPGGVGSSIHGIKTEMKYSGSAHPMPAHLQGHGHHNNHSLPSIPQSIYTPGAVGTALPSGHHGGSAGRPLGHMNNMQSHQPHYAPGPAHNLLSQSQQQKLHPHAQGGPLHHPQTHPTPPNLSGHAPSSVPTGLLLSGPSSALLHNASSSAGGVHGVTTLPSVSTAPASSTPMVMPPTPGAGLSIAAARSALPAAPASLAPPVTAPQPVAPMASAASPAPAAQPAVSVPVPPKPQ